MKKFLSNVVKRMTFWGNLGVLVGCFLPFVKGYDGFLGEYDTSVARYILEEESGKAGVAFVVIWIAVIVSWVALTSYKTYEGCAVSVTLLGCTVIGMCMYAVMIEELYFFDLSFEEKGIGAKLIEVSYVALIVAGVVAIGLKLYEKYNMDRVKEYLTMGRAQKDEVHRLCPNCGEKVTEKSKFCVKCGFSMEVFLCPKCGAKREKGALFCGECGVTLPVLPLTDILDESDSLIDMSCQEIDEEGDVDGNVRCQKCGHSFLIEERICPKCGTDSKIMV